MLDLDSELRRLQTKLRAFTWALACAGALLVILALLLRRAGS